MKSSIDSESGFWVTNISDRNVSLADLSLTIPAWRRVNLLDQKHYHYTLEQLEASATSGSLFKKRDKFKISKVAPEPISSPKIEVSKHVRLTNPRSCVKIIEKNYPELPNSDEKFADEYSDFIPK